MNILTSVRMQREVVCRCERNVNFMFSGIFYLNRHEKSLHERNIKKDCRISEHK